MWLTVDESKKFLYAVDATTDDSKPGLIHSYAINQATGELTPIGKVSSEGSVPCHMSVVGKTCLVANYVGGNVAAFPIGEDGTLGASTSTHAHGPGAGGHACDRMDAAHPHIITPGPNKKFAFVCDLGCNAIIGYSLDLAGSTLAKVSEVTLHAGAGPRHLAFSPSGRFAYSVNEMDNTVTPLSFDATAGTLTMLGEAAPSVSALPAGTPLAEHGGAAEIQISADGRFAYASVRMTGGFNACPEPETPEAAVFNTIAVFSLDAATGAATLVENVSSGGSMPWSHTFLDEDDSLLLVQNQHTKHTGKSEKEGGTNDGNNGEGPGRIVIFRRDAESGGLTELVAVEVPQAMCVTAVTL